MSSRAASGRKKLRPVPAPPSLPTIPQSGKPTLSSTSSYASPQDLRTPDSSLQVHSALSPSASTISSSSSDFPRHSSHSSRAQRPTEAASGFTPWSQSQPLSVRQERLIALRTRNRSPDSQSSSSAPSYTSLSEGGYSRHSSNFRSLPPYPVTPPVGTGWAARSDIKLASSIVVPPSYLEDPRPQTNPYPLPPLQSPFDPQISMARSGSVGSSSHLPTTPPTFERPQTPRSNLSLPYYSPSSSPRQPPLRLRGSSPLGAGSSKQRNRPVETTFLPDSSYPTPLSSSFASASLPVIGHHEPSLLSSAESLSGWSLASGAGRYSIHSTNQSSRAFSTTSSVKSSPSPTIETRPPDLFVFPSSRSRARPKAPSPGISGFKFRGRRKLKASLATVQVLAPGTPIPSEGVFTAQASAASGGDSDRHALSPPNLHLTPSLSAYSESSVSAPASPASIAPIFYFPSARTRAHPKRPTKFSLSKGNRKEQDGAKKPSFLGMGLHRKKADPNPVVAPEESTSPISDRTSVAPPPQVERRPTREDMHVTSGNVPQAVTEVGTYPLDVYDAGLLESDRQTWELLRKINSTNTPSFHNYSDHPPRYALDLGCGAGHWMLDAAVAWGSSGTQIIGFDMVDITKGLWPVARRKGVANNIRFVRGNFLKQSLPFPDASFQLVRMANLALCIPHQMWEVVLLEARRVLAVEGRLELIDDHFFFPYGKPSVPNHSASPQSVPPPHLDMMIPSAVFSRMSLADVVNPGIRAESDSDIYNLYGVVEEEEDYIASGQRRETPTPHDHSSSTLFPGPFSDSEAWKEQAAAARELESLFEQMINDKYGIHLHPSAFVLEMMIRIFGSAKEIAAMHLTLAPPDQSTTDSQSPTSSGTSFKGRYGGDPGQGSEATESDTLSLSPGLISWPSTTFIPMLLSEIETHASKHLQVLLSCKPALVDYSSQLADPGDAENQGEAAMEAVWDYQNFLRERFNPPPDDPSQTIWTDDSNSIQSLFSVNSMGSEALDAMRDYQNELHSRFEWTSEPAESSHETPTMTVAPRVGSIESAARPSTPPRTGKSRSRGSRGRGRTLSVTSVVAPPYSRIELTHVRTFYVFQAVKEIDSRFGGSI
ncbi:hypothetical protein C8R43DRAFT_1105634 [Mycena crocata]|nr:hypothetical protein C8R43DRAFT_1105634 [Mycena crocata]